MNNTKKVGVITYYTDNYGAFLQAYALQKTMEKLDYDCELINYDYIHDNTLLGRPWSNIRNPVRFCASILKRIILLKRIRKKSIIFQKSLDKNLRFSKQRFKSVKQLIKTPPQYDIYLTGSDQVWNPNIYPHGFKTRLLDFAVDKRGKLVSYAASIGLKELPHNKIGLFKEYLIKFDSISVREEEAKNILNEIINKDIHRHLDPTLLLSKNEWHKFGKKVNEINEPYIFVYMLAKQPELINFANHLSEKLNLKIVSAGTGINFKNRIIRDKFLSPEEFIWSIANAEYVVTNSFHGTCFSIIFNKRAHIFIPPSVQCRIVELINDCKLNRLLEDNIIENTDIEALYNDAEMYLEKERKKAYDYLNNLRYL